MNLDNIVIIFYRNLIDKSIFLRKNELNMSETSADTKKKLLESAKKEFLEKGFMNASLRTIAANAGAGPQLAGCAGYSQAFNANPVFTTDAQDITTVDFQDMTIY